MRSSQSLSCGLRALVLVACLAPVCCGNPASFRNPDPETVFPPRLAAQAIHFVGKVSQALAIRGASPPPEHYGILGGVAPFYPLIVGFPEPPGAHLGPAELAELLGELRSQVEAGALSAGAGSCATIPGQGKRTLPQGTLAFGPPTKTAPTNFTKTGAYHKSIGYLGKYSGRNPAVSQVYLQLQFFCDTAAEYAAMAYFDRSGGVLAKLEAFYEKTASGGARAQVFVSDDANAHNTQHLGVAIHVDPTTNRFQFWGARSGYDGSHYIGYRVAANSDYAAQKTSLYLTHNGGTAGSCLSTKAAFIGSSWAQSTSVSEGKTDSPLPDGCSTAEGNSPGLRLQGCLEGSSSWAAPAPSAGLCAGQTLSEPPAPGLDPAGALSMAWTETTLSAKMFTPVAP